MRWLTAVVLACALTGCAPTSRRVDAPIALPPAPVPQRFAPANGPAQTTDQTNVSSLWWSAFACVKLDALVADALSHANDVATADAALRQARALAGAAGSTALPQVDLNYQATRVRVSQALAPAVTNPDQYLYTLHTAQVTVSYGLDLFGANRGRLRSARAAAEAARHRLQAARVSVAANLVQAVIARAAAADQLDAARISVEVNRDVLRALLRRQRLGAIGAADVATQATALASAEATIPPLDRAEAHNRVVISALLGRAAGSPLPPLPRLAELSLPKDLPLVLPSDLVARRPDVGAARAAMVGAAADLGVAIAARYPQIQLSAQAGGEAQNLADIFTNGNLFYTLLGGVTQPLFHGGALRRQQQAAEATLEGAKAQYRAAVLQAFGDVSDALNGLRTDADALDAAARTSDAAAQALRYIRRQLELGDVGTLALLNATSADAQARVALVQARAARMADSVALFQAVGGGVRTEP